MLKRALAAAALAAPAFLVAGTVGAQPAGADVSAPCTTAEQGTSAGENTPKVNCRFVDRYGQWCKECYRYGGWRLEYCEDQDKDHDYD